MNSRLYRVYLSRFYIGAFMLGFFLCFGLNLNAQNPNSENVKIYHANGKIKEKGRLKNSEKSGTWLYYHTEGWLEKKEKYKAGKLQWAIYYNAKHQTINSIDKNGNEVPFRGCNCKN
jgi:flagellar hook assembly protein FlgD